MTQKPIIVVGFAGLDRVYRISAFPEKPTKVAALEHSDDGGGAAANAAATIARLGGAAELWSRVGDDEAGGRACRLLTRAGVDISAVRRLPGVATPTAAVIVDEKGERLVAGEDGRRLAMDAGWLPLGRIASAAAVLSDLSWLEGTLAAFTEARAHGVATVLDVDLGSGPLLGEAIPLTDVAIFSAPAFEAFIYGGDDAERLATVLATPGVRHAGVTRGVKGYTWKAEGGRSGRQESFKVPVVDTTGAGDAFHGAFTLALARGLDDGECARIASAVAALKCRRLGARAGLPTVEELDGFLLEQMGRGLAGW